MKRTRHNPIDIVAIVLGVIVILLVAGSIVYFAVGRAGGSRFRHSPGEGLVEPRRVLRGRRDSGGERPERRGELHRGGDQDRCRHDRRDRRRRGPGAHSLREARAVPRRAGWHSRRGAPGGRQAGHRGKAGQPACGVAAVNLLLGHRAAICQDRAHSLGEREPERPWRRSRGGPVAEHGLRLHLHGRRARSSRLEHERVHRLRLRRAAPRGAHRLGLPHGHRRLGCPGAPSACAASRALSS